MIGFLLVRGCLKTRKKLENALLFYLKQESLNEIKVSLLCEKADVSRATFYNNFDSVQDVFKAYLIDLSAPLKADIKKATDSDSSREEIELMFQGIEKQKKRGMAIIYDFNKDKRKKVKA